MIFKDKKELIQSLGIRKSDTILDIGFNGQGVKNTDGNWVHGYFLQLSNNVFGIDTNFDEDKFKNKYKKFNAENFKFDNDFDLIFAGDLIEHLSNPGLFLESCKQNIAKNGRLVITTPNCFNLFNLAEKLTKYEPTTHYEHTCYYNHRMLRQLLERHGFKVVNSDYIYTLGVEFKESYKKKVLNITNKFITLFTDKFSETLAVTATLK